MKLAKIIGWASGLILLMVIALVIFYSKDSSEELRVNHQTITTNTTKQYRQDDQTYGQEIRALTAKLKFAEEKLKRAEKEQKEAAQQAANQLDQKLEAMQQQIAKSKSDKTDESNELTQIITEIKAQKELTETENNALRKQITTISEQFETYKKELAEQTRLIEQKQAENVEAMLNETEKSNQELNASSAQNFNNGWVSHKPYSPNIQRNEVKNSTENVVNNTGLDLSKLSDTINGVFGENKPFQTEASQTQERLINPVNQVSAQVKEASPPLTKFPVYTLPVSTLLTDSTLLTPLVGRVPLSGNVNDPFKFQIELGADNLAANGHRIPGISKAILSGTAIGNREQSCVRGTINSMTFIFEDGRISNTQENSNNNANQGIGYLTDPFGTPCINGKYINNAGSYLRDRSLAAFLSGLAGAYGQAQIRRDFNEGFASTFVSGNAYQFAAAQGISNSAQEIADYVRERASGAFDVIYVPQNTKVQIIVEKQIPIDYDLKSRKVSYVNEESEVNYD